MKDHLVAQSLKGSSFFMSSVSKWTHDWQIIWLFYIIFNNEILTYFYFLIVAVFSTLPFYGVPILRHF